MNKILLIILFLFIITGCNTKSPKVDILGHILFIHTGEEDKPVDPLSIVTKNDTTYLKYKYLDPSLPSSYVYSYYTHEIGYAPYNIEFVDVRTYVKFKEALLEFKNQNENLANEGSIGSLVVLIHDNVDSTWIKIPSNKKSIEFLSYLTLIASTDSLTNASMHFGFYKQLQVRSIE